MDGCGFWGVCSSGPFPLRVPAHCGRIVSAHSGRIVVAHYHRVIVALRLRIVIALRTYCACALSARGYRSRRFARGVSTSTPDFVDRRSG